MYFYVTQVFTRNNGQPGKLHAARPRYSIFFPARFSTSKGPRQPFPFSFKRDKKTLRHVQEEDKYMAYGPAPLDAWDRPRRSQQQNEDNACCTRAHTQDRPNTMSSSTQ